MSYRFKLFIGLFILLCLVVLYIADERFSQKQIQKEESNSVALYFENSDCTLVSLTNEHGTFTFERETFADLWIMTSPKQLLADQDTINSMLVSLRNISVQREVLGEQNIHETGLDNPKIRIELGFEKDKSQILEFGHNLSVQSESAFQLPSAYAKVSSKNGVLVVDNSSISTFSEQDFSQLRTKKIANFNLSDVSFISVHQLSLEMNDKLSEHEKSDSNIELQSINHQWMSVAPVQTKADSAFIVQYLQMFQNTSADRVIESPLENKLDAIGINLASPAASIILKNPESEIIYETSLYLSKSGVFIQMKDGALAQIELDQWPTLVPKFKAFRDRSVFLNTQCSAKISTLTALDIIDNVPFDDFKKYGLDKPLRELKCSNETSDDSSSEPSVLIGGRVPFDEKSLYVKRSDSDTVYIVDNELLSALAD